MFLFIMMPSGDALTDRDTDRLTGIRTGYSAWWAIIKLFINTNYPVTKHIFSHRYDEGIETFCSISLNEAESTFSTVFTAFFINAIRHG